MNCPLEWSGIVEGYAKNFIYKNIWKFSRLGYASEDLYQEAYIVYHFCRKRYSDTDPANFMALFKTCLRNTLYDLQQKHCYVCDSVIDEDFFDLNIDLKVEEESTLYVMLKEAPKEIKEVLSLLFNAPSELIESAKSNKKQTKNICSNQFLCQQLGYNPLQINLIKMVRNYFLSF